MNGSMVLIGAADVMAALRAMPVEVQRKVLPRAIRAAAKPVLAAAKARCPVQTGLLRASLGVKYGVYRDRSGMWARIGPRRRFKRATIVDAASGKRRIATTDERKAMSKAQLGDKRTMRNPAKYAHLVEFGHRIARGGLLRAVHRLIRVDTGRVNAKGRKIKTTLKGEVKREATGTVGGSVPAKPFLRPAWDSTRTLSHATVKTELWRGIAAEVRKQARRAKRIAAQAQADARTAARLAEMGID